MYSTWVTAAIAVLAAISFLMLALALHHATRNAVHHDAISMSDGGTLGFHDGDG